MQIGRIDVNNIGAGAAMNLITRVDPTTASRAQNSAKGGEPSATGGSNSGDLALAAIEMETLRAGGGEGSAIIGSSANARAAAAATPGTVGKNWDSLI